MAYALVRIKIDHVTAQQIRDEPDFWEDGKIVIDKAELNDAYDDSFCAFDLVELTDG